MLKNIIPREHKTMIERSIEFTNADGGGFSFDADENGKPILENEGQRLNYAYAIEHPERFPVQYNEFVETERDYIEPGRGTCHCGAEVILDNFYHGATFCRNCNQWYNLFGQELLHPDHWDE